MSIVGTSWTVVITDKRSRKLSQSMDDFDGSINGHSYTVLNFILYGDKSTVEKSIKKKKIKKNREFLLY